MAASRTAGLAETPGVRVRRLRLRAPAGEAPAIRAALERADWPTAPGRAWVLVREVRVSATGHGLAARASERLQSLVRGAAPIDAPGAEGAEAVFCRDLAALIAALCADLAAGRAIERWYWRSWSALFGLPRGQAVARLMAEAPEVMTTVTERLARRDLLASVWRVLGPADVIALAHALAGWLGRAIPGPPSARGGTARRAGLPPPGLVGAGRPRFRVSTRSTRGVGSPPLSAHWSGDRPRWIRPRPSGPSPRPGCDADARAPREAHAGSRRHRDGGRQGLGARDHAPREDGAGSHSQTAASPAPESQASLRPGSGSGAGLGWSARPLAVRRGRRPPDVGRLAAGRALRRRPEATALARGMCAWGPGHPGTAAGDGRGAAAGPSGRRPAGSPTGDGTGDLTPEEMPPEPWPRPATAPAAEGLAIRHGGLFYLINFLSRPEARALLAAHADSDGAPEGWALLWDLGRRLGLGPDPALAGFFAERLGLEPTASPWDLPALGIGPVLEDLGTRLYGSDLFAGPLLVVPARLYHTPSHLDLDLPLAAVRIAVRRVALDVDPGWVPWLGRVVAFRYLGHWGDPPETRP